MLGAVAIANSRLAPVAMATFYFALELLVTITIYCCENMHPGKSGPGELGVWL